MGKGTACAVAQRHDNSVASSEKDTCALWLKHEPLAAWVRRQIGRFGQLSKAHSTKDLCFILE